MFIQAVTIAVLMLFAVALPGPDFAMVTKNTLVHSRKSGFITAVGIGIASLIHMLYCTLGLALIILNSPLLFNVIKYLGASYLVYLGIKSLLSHQINLSLNNKNMKKSSISDWTAFRQGVLCNLLNPKATLFFLALFTTLIKPETPKSHVLFFVLEMFFIITTWFLFLAIILSHPKITLLLTRAEPYIEKILGAFLIVFAVLLVFTTI